MECEGLLALLATHNDESALVDALVCVRRDHPRALEDERVLRAYVRALVTLLRSPVAARANWGVLGLASVLPAPDALTAAVADDLGLDRAQLDATVERESSLAVQALDNMNAP